MTISALQISTNKQDEKALLQDRYTKVPGNLNTGTPGPEVYLWFKKGTDNPITRIQFSFRSDMQEALSSSNFTLVDKNINAGTEGDPIYLWYMSGPTDYDVSIGELRVTTSVTEEPALFKSGWERLGCDLNRGAGGDSVYLWVKRNGQTYISDIKGSVSEDTALFNAGFFRVDEDTNREAKPAGSPVFLWYQHTTGSANAINKISVSLTTADEDNLRSQGFIKVDIDLNGGSCGNSVYLWYKRGQTSKIQYFTVLVGDEARRVYTGGNSKVVEKNLNNGNGGTPLYIAYYAE